MPEISPAIAMHLIAATLAIAIGAMQFIGRKGDYRHRILGRMWALAIVAASFSSFVIFEINDGRPSVIHILSVWILMSLTIALWALHRRRQSADAQSREKYLRRHRNFMIGTYAGLIAAGVGALIPGRLLPDILSAIFAALRN